MLAGERPFVASHESRGRPAGILICSSEERLADSSLATHSRGLRHRAGRHQRDGPRSSWARAFSLLLAAGTRLVRWREQRELRMGKGPLTGIRIADLSTVVFGPYCTQILADLGAEVIKIEPLEGDTARNIGTPANTPGMGPVHLRLNRGKRSVVWNMKTEKGKKAMRRLVETSDVLIHNIRPDAIDRLKLAYEDVRKI